MVVNTQMSVDNQKLVSNLIGEKFLITQIKVDNFL